MNSVMTQWAFGFGGWIGTFGGIFLFLNVPHNYTALLLLLSPWLGAISLYLLMFATFSWMNVCVQVASAMLKHEIIVAVLTSFMGVMIVAIARMIIEMERGHRTPAQTAAEESAATTAALPPSPPSEPETASANDDSDAETKSLSEHEESSDNEKDEESSDEESDESDEEITEKEDNDEESSDEEDDGEEDGEDSGEKADSESSLNKARTDSSYENIQTPQLSAIKPGNVSPIPTIADV